MIQYKRWAIYTSAAFLLISATLINTPNLYYMAAVLIALPWISYFYGMFALRGLSFTRDVPASAWEGETATFHIIVQSAAHLHRLFIQAEDALPGWITLAQPAAPLFNVEAGGVTRIPYKVALNKRGAYMIESMRVTALDPLGIYAFGHSYPVRSELLVYPTPQAMPDFPLSGAERFGFRELPVAASKGYGIDPDGVREYIPGDPLRRVHWKSTARTGKLSVIEFEEAHAVNVVIAVDTYNGANAGDGRDAAIEYLVTAAASIAQMAVRQNASVRLVAGRARDASNTAGRGTEHLLTVLAGLARVEPNEPTPLSRMLIDSVGPLAPGTTLIVLTSAVDSDLPGALGHYSLTGSEVVVVYVDLRTFPGGERMVSRSWQQSFLSGLAAANCTSYVVRANSDRAIKPELVKDVRLLPHH